VVGHTDIHQFPVPDSPLTVERIISL